jgi:hypothetical protein
MPDLLRTAFDGDAAVSLETIVVRLISALALGCAVAAVFRFTHGRPGPQSLQLMSTLVLLAVLIAAMTIVIGDNVARAFSLVGALAIVRFRTVVEDTRDVAFVIFAVTVGMAVGAGFLLIPLVTLPVAGLAAFLFSPRRTRTDAAAPPAEFVLTVRVGASTATDAALRSTLAAHAERARLESTATARQGASIETSWSLRLRDEGGADALVAALNRVEGVQAAELRRAQSPAAR